MENVTYYGFAFKGEPHLFKSRYNLLEGDYAMTRDSEGRWTSVFANGEVGGIVNEKTNIYDGNIKGGHWLPFKNSPFPTPHKPYTLINLDPGANYSHSYFNTDNLKQFLTDNRYEPRQVLVLEGHCKVVDINQ